MHTLCCPRFTGPTVHFVDEEYDTGPILAQRVVPVYPTDTPQQLAARVLVEVSSSREGEGRRLGAGCWGEGQQQGREGAEVGGWR
jgi:hypothetical protein